MQKLLTCTWSLVNNWSRYYTSSSKKRFVWFSWRVQKSVERRQLTLNLLATKNVSAIAPAETTYDWSNTVTWTVPNTAWVARIRNLWPLYLLTSKPQELKNFGVQRIKLTLSGLCHLAEKRAHLSAATKVTKIHPWFEPGTIAWWQNAHVLLGYQMNGGRSVVFEVCSCYFNYANTTLLGEKAQINTLRIHGLKFLCTEISVTGHSWIRLDIWPVIYHAWGQDG